MDKNRPVAVNVIADIPSSPDALTGKQTEKTTGSERIEKKIREDLGREPEDSSGNSRFPLRPERIISDVRKVMGEDDIVLADTGAIKTWRARPYLTCRPSACPIPNGLSTMSFPLPGAPGARIANPDRKILAATIGDNSFLMNSQEPETAIREKLHFVALLRVDQNYGLIKWSMEPKRGQAVDVHFNNPDFLKHAKNFGAFGRLVGKANDPVSLLDETFN